MKLQMSFGENLVNLRKQKGWSQDDLAENLNLSRQAISKWENDTSKPDIDNVMKISKLFSVTIDDLVNNDVVKDKAVTLNVKKEEKKERLVIIVKCMIIAIILLYVINVIYKFASLLIIVNGIQKYANLSNYHYVITTYDENGLVEKEECWFKDGVSKTVIYSNGNTNILCVNYNSEIAYTKLSEYSEKSYINYNDYVMAHNGYKYGGQLIDVFPKNLTKNNCINSIANSINYNLNINIQEYGIAIQTRNKYMILKKDNMLPEIMYSNNNNTTKIYAFEINSIEKIDI